MAKKLTYQTTRTDPSIDWYYQTARAANSEAWNERLAILVAYPDSVSTEIIKTDTTLTSIITFTDDSLYEQFVAINTNAIPDVVQYCQENGITYDLTVEDI